MPISHQELQTIAFTLANEESPLLHFKSGFVDGEHQLIAVFSECEEVINTCWGCQADNAKKLNALMDLSQDEMFVVNYDQKYWEAIAKDVAADVISDNAEGYISEFVDRNIMGEDLSFLVSLAKQGDNHNRVFEDVEVDMKKDFDDVLAQMAHNVLSRMVGDAIKEQKEG